MKRLAGYFRRHAVNLEQDTAGLHNGCPMIRRALTFTHTHFGGLTGHLLIREYPDPYTSLTFHMTGQRYTGGFNLPVGDPDGFHGLQSERAKGDRGSALVTRSDLRGALHNHTIASDGTATLEQMRDAAAARGLTYLGISDHSVSAFYARGLDHERLLEQARTIATMEANGCTLLSGVESDILQDGALDYADDVLSELDLVIASVHRRHAQTAEQMTARMVAAAQNPWTAVVGHPTGRLLLGRDPSEYDMGAFLDACATHGCAVELNANPHRLDLNERHLAMAKERGLLVSIAADAHSVDELDHLDYGITIARRAGLTAEDVLNARSLGELSAWLGERRSAAAKGKGLLVR